MSGPSPKTNFLPQHNNDRIGPFCTWELIHSFKKCLLSAYLVPDTVLCTENPGEHFVIIVARDPSEHFGADSSGEDEQ